MADLSQRTAPGLNSIEGAAKEELRHYRGTSKED